MSSQIHFSNDQTRTNWTLAMERYFIDLMLDQLQRGNRMGHTFTKQAWIDMLTMFNAKFGTKYDWDILRSHYTNLWKQYSDVKNLLEQNGFSWDDIRKMVVADEDAWGEFVKTHPDALCYKNKSLINFNDLCLIYAYTRADGRYSRSSHDIDMDDDIQGLNIGDGIAGLVGGIALPSFERMKKNWTAHMDRYFVELMVEQVERGNKVGKAFCKQAWKDMLTLFNAKFGCQFGSSFLKRRYRKLFKYYAGMRKLLERKGFSWDEKQQKIVANDDVWDKYIKAHPDANSYRKKTLPNFKDLSFIYENEFINGQQGHMHQKDNFEDEILRVNAGYENNGYYSSGDFVELVWTPAMDRYFIDLLQDQALRGNKIGHDLTTKAWVEVIGLFGAKFGPQYDKEALQNRFTHLRGQYNGIKLLLEQNGFYWDENREMVIAEAHVWDSYTQLHPVAQSYRNISVPSYHKLCVIYGEEIPNERYSHIDNSVDYYGEVPGLAIGKEFQCHSNGDLSRTDWTPSMERHLIDLMLKEVHRGNRIDCSSDRQAWVDMAVLFKEYFGSHLNKDVLRIHCRSLAKVYKDMKYLLSHRGFSWDEERQLVMAGNDVWDAFIKEHPDARSYKTKPKPNINDLCLIYGKPLSDKGDNQADRGAKFSNSSWRSNWTPPMDRFFIDLMLQHVCQGSMVNQRFNEFAWSDMVSKFSAEFGSQHDEHVLKSRFMMLRDRFIDMKSLLDQSGFAWDELQQMIIADDHVWKGFMKEYPDWQSYRNKALPNYNDLFMIYENAKLGGHDCLSCSTAADDYILGTNVAEENGAYNADIRINWTKTMEDYFIKLMLEQVLRGNKIGLTFSEQAWTWIIASFNEKFGLLCDNENAESWHMGLREEYRNIKNLLNQNGFSWDESERKLMANDVVWKRHIKEHPGAVKYRDRVLSSYSDLCKIYGNRTPVGRSHLAVNVESENDQLYSGNGIFGDAIYRNKEFNMSDRRKKRKFVTVSALTPSSRVQRPKREAQEWLVRKAPVTNPLMGCEEDDEHVPVEDIVSALQAIPDMHDELFLEACKLLENEKKAKAFVSMNVSRRRKWLFRKLCK